jgi:hypothetical protein
MSARESAPTFTLRDCFDRVNESPDIAPLFAGRYCSAIAGEAMRRKEHER